MKTKTFHIVITSALFAMVLSPAQARIKCWENSDGVQECGNSVPPEYSQQNTKQLNKHGVTTNVSSRAKTRAELDEEERLAKLERQKKAEIQKQKEADQLLLDSFASSDDIILAKEGKLSSLASEISLRKTHIEKIQSNLDKIVAAAANMERRGEKPTEKIINDIRSVKIQIVENKNYIKAKLREQELVRQKYDEDLLRYNKLHSDPSYQVSLD